MDPRCPFCWDKNVVRVGRPLRRLGDRYPRQLMECLDCEKWYWEGTGREVARLFEICATAIVSPGSCCGEIREVVGSGGIKWPRRRSSEFNWLCSECPHARFMARGAGEDPGSERVSLC
jgi:hypothetical protein